MRVQWLPEAPCLASFGILSNTRAEKAAAPAYPILYTVSEETVEARLAALRAGGQGFLTRPYHSDDIERLLKSCARHSNHLQKPRRLVMVEDDRSMARLITATCDRTGTRSNTSKTQRSLLETLASFRPSLLLLDLNLPDVSGGGASTSSGEFPAFMTLPILFLSGKPRTPPKSRPFAAARMALWASPCGRKTCWAGSMPPWRAWKISTSSPIPIY